MMRVSRDELSSSMFFVENPPKSNTLFKSIAFPSMIRTVPHILLIFKSGEIIHFG